MPRPRAPHIFALTQLVFRLGALATALTGLVVLVKLAIDYPDVNNHQGKTFGGAISMVRKLLKNSGISSTDTG